MRAASRPTLFYVVDWLPPDFGAVGQYGMLFAGRLAEQGRRVCLVGLTTGPARVERRTFRDGGALEIRRVPAAACDKARRYRRLAWAVRANLKLIGSVIGHPESRRSEVLFTGSPPFMLYFVLLVRAVRGAKLSYRITDFHPEVSIAESGRGPLLAALERITWFVRRRVDAFEALGEDQRRLLVAGGIPPELITLKRDVTPVEITGREMPARVPRPLAAYKVLLYSGNYGVAHDADTAVEGLIRHHRAGSGRFGLWLNASGTKADDVARRLAAGGVPVAHTMSVGLDRLPAVLAAADVHLITLRAGFAGYVLPSKVYACIASRRPIAFVGPADSDIHLLCAWAGLPYERIEPGDAVGFAEALERLATPVERSAETATPKEFAGGIG